MEHPYSGRLRRISIGLNAFLVFIGIGLIVFAILDFYLGWLDAGNLWGLTLFLIVGIFQIVFGCFSIWKNLR